MTKPPRLQRCDACGQNYPPHLGSKGLCFECATHLGCACADDADPADSAELPRDAPPLANKTS